MDKLDFGEPDLPRAPQDCPKGAARPNAAPRFKIIDRQQQEFRVFALDDLIDAVHPARAIWDFLDRVDLTDFAADVRAVEGRAGQSAHDPQVLAALWLYGYSEGIGSAREIGRCCEYHPGFRWLCGDAPVNYHTLSDFRVDHETALRNLLVDALGVLSYEGLIKLERVAHDGSKVRAVAGEGSFHREKTVAEHLAAAVAQVQELDNEEAEGSTKGRKAAQQRAAQERQQRLQWAQEQMEKIRKNKKTAEEKAQVRVSESEPEARMMKMPDGGFAPAYNLQVTTDAEAILVVNADLTDIASDFPHLAPAVEQIQENFGKVPDQVLADAGFVSRDSILQLDGRTDLIGAYDEGKQYCEAQRRRQGIAEEFAASVFVHDRTKNQLICPAGKCLRAQRSKSAVGKIEHYYTAAEADCQACPHKQQCCPQACARRVLCIEDHEAVTRFRQKMQTESAMQLYKQRARIAEFPFCWLKEKFQFRRFHVRGLAKARMELWWVTLAYNIRQWMRLRWCARVAVEML